MKKAKKPVAQPKPQFRSLEEINQEYRSLCMQAGELQHRIAEGPAQVVAINRRLSELQNEGAAAQQREAAEAAKAAKP